MCDPRFAAALALALAGACSPYVQRGETLYREGRYVEAAEVFELTEQRLPTSTPVQRAEYGLYRGLTFLRLDDLQSARQWLGYVTAETVKDPGLLGPTHRTMLERAWTELEQRTRAQPPPAGVPGRVAATDTPSALPRGGGGANGRRSVAPQ